MRNLLALAAALAVLGTGCVVVPLHHPEAAAVQAEKRCPPGHQWSDGRCHERGKGHDRDRD